MSRAQNKQRNLILPEVFIVSSTESERLAWDIQSNLQENAHGTVWNQGLVEPSTFVLDQLINVARQSDFGVFIFASDDVIRIRGKKWSAVRDNVIFELGLFMGRLGRERCFIVVPKSHDDLRIPTDLAGLTLLGYDESHPAPRSALGPPCNDMRKVMKRLGSIVSVLPPPSAGDVVDDIEQRVSRPVAPISQRLSIKTLPRLKLQPGGPGGSIDSSSKKR